MICEPLCGDEHHGRQQHIEPQLTAQPIPRTGREFIVFEYGSIHVRKSSIREIHRDMNASIALCSCVESWLVCFEDGFAELLFGWNGLSVNRSNG